MAPPVRVLQVVLSLNPGGTERLVVDLASRLHATIPMRVCCLDEAGAWAASLRDRSIEVDALGRQPGFHPGLGRAIATLATRHRATLIHAHHYSPFVYSCLARMWTRRARVIFTEHGRVSDAPPSARRRLANRAFSRVPEAVFAVSEDLKRHIVREGFAANAVRVIYNGIEAGAPPPPPPEDRDRIRRDLGAAEDTLVVGTVARLDPVKDLGVLLEALARLVGERPTLAVVVGDGPERGRLERRAGDLGVGARVRWLGHRDDARAWLAGCDVFVNCSVSEGVSLTILEAMAAGLPVVATAVGGTPEVVTGDCGVLVPARDPSALAEAIGALGRDANRRGILGAAARRRVEDRFTLDRMVAAYRDVYCGVA